MILISIYTSFNSESKCQYRQNLKSVIEYSELQIVCAKAINMIGV